MHGREEKMPLQPALVHECRLRYAIHDWTARLNPLCCTDHIEQLRPELRFFQSGKHLWLGSLRGVGKWIVLRVLRKDLAVYPKNFQFLLLSIFFYLFLGIPKTIIYFGGRSGDGVDAAAAGRRGLGVHGGAAEFVVPTADRVCRGTRGRGALPKGPRGVQYGSVSWAGYQRRTEFGSGMDRHFCVVFPSGHFLSRFSHLSISPFDTYRPLNITSKQRF